MRTNMESQSRHSVCVEWFLEGIKAVLGLESLFHIIIQCRTNSCFSTTLIATLITVTLRQINALKAMKIFHYIRLWSESLVLWCVMPNHEQ